MQTSSPTQYVLMKYGQGHTPVFLGDAGSPTSLLKQAKRYDWAFQAAKEALAGNYYLVEFDRAVRMFHRFHLKSNATTARQWFSM